MQVSHRWLIMLRASSAWLAAAIWLVAFAIVSYLVVVGRLSTVSYNVYAAAGTHWLHHTALYQTRDIEGFQYFPHAAMLAAPFAWLGQPLGGIVWRGLWWGACASGIFRLARALVPQHSAEAFLFATCVALGPALGPLGNGQANLALAALMLHASADLIAGRDALAAGTLVLGFALKPLMAVPLLLIAVLYRRVRWPMLGWSIAVGALPWLLKDPRYLARQIALCSAKLQLAALPSAHYENLRGLLATLGLVMSRGVALALAALAAVLTLAAGWLIHARIDQARPERCLWIMALAASYLMLFNPRTQSTSYAIPGVLAALLATRAIMTRDLRPRLRAALPLLVVIAAWSVSYHAFPFVELWLKPLACLVFVTLVAVEATDAADATQKKRNAQLTQ